MSPFLVILAVEIKKKKNDKSKLKMENSDLNQI